HESPSNCGEEEPLRVASGACGTLTRVDRPGTSIESTLQAIQGEIDVLMVTWEVPDYHTETKEIDVDGPSGRPDPRTFGLVTIFDSTSEYPLHPSFAVIASDGTRYELNWCPD